MQIHGSCASREGVGVLVVGPAGSGKSDLVLRLLDRGFALVADDRVEIAAGVARPVASLAGLLEVRGLGILRLPFEEAARLGLLVDLGAPVERLPAPDRDAVLDLPRIGLDAHGASAAQRVSLALNCVLGRNASLVGAFAP